MNPNTFTDQQVHSQVLDDLIRRRKLVKELERKLRQENQIIKNYELVLFNLMKRGVPSFD